MDVFVIGFAVIGSLFVLNSLAASPNVSHEAENGTVNSPAVKVNDATASGGQYVKFGGAQQSGRDLEIVQTEINWIAPVPGDNVFLYATVRNNGTIATPNNTKHRITFKVDGVTVASTENYLASIPAKGVIRIGADTGFWDTTAGTHSLSATIDDGNLIAESNENNNTFTKSYTITANGYLFYVPQSPIARMGGEVDVSLYIYPNGTFDRVNVTLNWDPTKLELVTYLPSLQFDQTFVPLTITSGQIRFDAGISASSTRNMYVFEPVFKALVPGGTSTLSVSGSVSNDGVNKNVAIYGSTVSFMPADTTPPTTNITFPANGATVSGNINVTATATDNFWVDRIYFEVDGKSIGADVTSPYSRPIDTTTLTNGTHTISAYAGDDSKNLGPKHTISVNVRN